MEAIQQSVLIHYSENRLASNCSRYARNPAFATVSGEEMSGEVL